MDSKRKIISTAALVAFLVACGGGGGAQAIAEHISTAMFDALSARVSTNESSIAALEATPPPPVPGVTNLVNDAQEVPGDRE